MSSPICVVSHLMGNHKTWMLPSTVLVAGQLQQFLMSVEGCPEDLIMLQCCGRPLSPGDALPPNSTVTAMLSLRGGKGGFGSMLRAIGAQIEKTTNKEACRDLSGRRLRDINKEKLLKEQLQKRAEKERERLANRKKRFEVLKQEPKHVFNDSSFYKEQEEITQALFDSVDKGLKVAAAQQSEQKKHDSSASTSKDDQSQLEQAKEDSNDSTSKTQMSGKGTTNECAGSSSDTSKQETGKSSLNADVAESGPSSSGCSSGAESSEQDAKTTQNKAVKRSHPPHPATKKLPAKKRRFFDDLDESSDDSDSS